jgi:selenocysteine-specific elongation factor
MIIGTAGHIDHGKTALVKALTGVDADRLPEEKRRGITIDLGFAPLQLDGIGIVGVIDVPGHEDFVRSMLVGASGIDLGMLVVAADEGVMPQTREHLLILGLLQIPRLVVAITKRDLVDREWLELVRADVSALLSERTLSPAPVVACSARTGAGLDELRSALAAELAGTTERSGDDLFRMPIDRAFTIKGTGTVVTGTVWSGDLPVDTAVIIQPVGTHSRVRRIEQHGAASANARAGSRAAIALASVDVSEVARGCVLVSDESWRPTTLFEAVISLDADIAAELSARTRLRLHAGASEVGVRVILSRSSEPAARSLARIATDGPLVLRGGDRFVLRLPAPLRTIGGGVVVDPYARRRPLPVTSESQLEALTMSAESRLSWLLNAEALRGVPIADIPVRAGCSPAEAAALVNRVGALREAHNLFALPAVEQVMASVRRIVAEYEIKSPLNPGIPARTLREGLRVRDELADISIREMEQRREIESVGPLLRRPGWVPSPSDRDSQEADRLAHDICAGETEPPSVSELVARYGSSVPGLLRFLERQGRIVQVETDRYYDRAAIDALIERLRAKLVAGEIYAPAQLRDVLGFSRKYLIPFLEFCDRNGITERKGVGRVLKRTTSVLLDTSEAHS